MLKSIFPYLKVLFFLCIGLFFIWLFLNKLTPDEKQEILNSFSNVDYFWVMVSIFFGVISHVIRSLRWNLMLSPMGYHPRFLNTFSAVMIGYLANLALPRLGEVTKCGILNRYEKIPINKSFGTIIAERAVDLILFLVIFFLTIFVFFTKLEAYYQEKFMGPLAEKFDLSGKLMFYLYLIGGAVLVITFGLYYFRGLLTKNRIFLKVKGLFLGLWQGLKSIANVKNPGLFITYSILIWVMYYMMTYVCFLCFPETSDLGFGAGLAVLMFGSIGIMVVQGGIGIYPAIVAETLIIYSISGTIGYALGWLLWSAQTVMIIASGIISFIILPIINSKKNGST